MEILILGGTVFLGRAFVEAALEKNHHITLFNRGRSNPGLFPQVKHLQGDRETDLSALETGSWDAVIDTCGYLPRVVHKSAQLLKDRSSHYTFISSISVYADVSQLGVNEDAPVALLEDPNSEDVNQDYGPLKALCERAAENAMPGRTLVIRPGLIVGPHDPSDRFSYWPSRIAYGGKVLAPGRPGRQVQFIDVRDLAEWIIKMIEEQKTGIYNATGLQPEVSMGEFLETCRSVSASDADLIWVSEEFLEKHQVGSWIELPLWLPEKEPTHAGLFSVDINKALSDGLTFRPVGDTVQDTLEWIKTRPAAYTWRAGLKHQREQELLEAWKAGE